MNKTCMQKLESALEHYDYAACLQVDQSAADPLNLFTSHHPFIEFSFFFLQ